MNRNNSEIVEREKEKSKKVKSDDSGITFGGLLFSLGQLKYAMDSFECGTEAALMVKIKEDPKLNIFVDNSPSLNEQRYTPIQTFASRSIEVNNNKKSLKWIEKTSISGIIKLATAIVILIAIAITIVIVV
ncbi:uncharacterized protein LOC123300820 [Chrysoperla carnea]|uniref:uncharacterized protein LOC123300820 n=1 Tax=Chrysoperla carnea TaxID=189513 RepID=UPI001D06A019|nr:uncharacterized protein LOC123300820 [Chrysoperla carnea]